MRWVDFKDSMKRFWEDYKHQKSGMVGIGLLIVLVVLALGAPLITNPHIPKEWQTGTAWSTNPSNAPPAWLNHFSSVTKAPEKVYHYGNFEITNHTTRFQTVYTLKFKYDMHYDVPPTGIVLANLISNASNPRQNPRITMIMIRPKEPGIKNNRVTLVNDMSIPSNVTLALGSGTETSSYVSQWLMMNGILVPPTSISTTRILMNVLFGQLTTSSGQPLPLNHILHHSTALKGTYTFVINITVPKGVSVNLHKFAVYVVGDSYGLLGTDSMGRPISIGILWGTRVALAIGVSVAIASVLIGILIGVTSAYLGGWSDEAIQRFTEFMMTLPILPMLILLSLYFGGSITLLQLVLILVLFGWMGTEKVARSMALQIKEQTYIEAARALGAGTGRVVFKHMVPQLLPYAFANIALSVPGAILAEAGLSFLNLTSKNIITWGQMLNYAHQNGATINGYWWQVVPPGLAIAVVGLVFVLIGVSLDKVLNPRLRRA